MRLVAAFGRVLLVACVTLNAPAAPIERVTGNGVIVVGAGADGALLSLQWPGPGAPQQLTPPGGAWYILDGEQPPQPLHGPGWTVTQDWTGAASTVIETRYSGPDGTRRMTQHIGAVPGRDLLVVRLQLQGFPSNTRACWVQSAAPTRIRPPGLARVHGAIARNGVCTVRYDSAAHDLVFASPASAAVASERDTGSNSQVLIGVGALGDVARGGVLLNETDWLRGGVPALETAAPQSFPGLLEPMPGTTSGSLDFTVLIAVSETTDGLREALQWGRNQRADSLFEEARAGASAWLKNLGTPLTESTTRPFLNLVLLHDPTTGAQLRATATLETAPWCDAIASAWVAAALDDLSLHGPAERVLATHLETVRDRGGPDGPSGSLARRVYINGRGADLRDTAHAESAAWLVVACLRHAAVLQGESGKAYAARVWPEISLLLDFLARDPEVGASLIQGIDGNGASLEQLRVHYLGLEAGRRLGELLGRLEPTVQADRRGEVYARIRFRQMNGPGSEVVDGVPLDWWIARWPVPGAGWDGLLQEGAPPFTKENIERLVRDVEFGPDAPLALRDALRLLAPAP